MERTALDAVKRVEGKGGARKLRRQKMIPGVIYGKGYNPVYVSVDEKALEKAVSTHAGLNVIMDLSIEGKDKVVARVCSYQAHPIDRNFTHVDFQVLDLKKRITVEVSIQIEGKAKGVKEGGILVNDRRTLSVKCLPIAIPEKITIDITELDIGDSIHIDDLKLPENVECPHDVNFAIVSVVAPMKEEVVAPTVAVEGVVTAEGVVIPAAGVAGVAPVGAPGTAPTAGGVKSAPGAAPAGVAVKPAGAPAKEKK